MTRLSLERVFEPTALLVSYAFELGLLPKHAYRLASLRLASKRTLYELSLGMAEELAALRAAIKVAKQAERELEKMDLSLESSRMLAVKAYREAILNLRRRVRERLLTDVPLAKRQK